MGCFYCQVRLLNEDGHNTECEWLLWATGFGERDGLIIEFSERGGLILENWLRELLLLQSLVREVV